MCCGSVAVPHCHFECCSLLHAAAALDLVVDGLTRLWQSCACCWLYSESKPATRTCLLSGNQSTCLFTMLCGSVTVCLLVRNV